MDASTPAYKRCPRCGAVTFYTTEQARHAPFHVCADGQVVPAAGGLLPETAPDVFHCASCSWCGRVEELLPPAA